MSVRAKFYVKSVAWSHSEHDEDGKETEKFFTVELGAVNKCSGPNQDEEDDDSIFGRFTPSAELRMVVCGPAATWYRDRVGEKVYVDFTSA
jgi:hypothetical protein